VILALKFSKFITLSILELIHKKLLLHCIYLVHCVLALGNPVLELLFEDFQEQVFEELEAFFSRKQGKCP
jgi:hypothetical protein